MRTYLRHPLAHLITLATLVSGAGCGQQQPAPTFPVTGRVVFADGTPLASGGTIHLEAVDGYPYNARGAIQKDGTFQLSTFGELDGAVLGKHQAMVQAKRDTTDWTERGIVPRPVIDERFENYDTSGLEYNIEESNNELDVVVERPAKQPILRQRAPAPR